MHNKPHSEETKRKLSAANIGRKLSEETKRKLSEIFKGENHPQFGKPQSEETKRKIGAANMGRRHSDESKRKRSEKLKGENHYNWKGGISKTKGYQADFSRERRKDNPKIRLSDGVSNGIRSSLKGAKAGRHWEELVGYTLKQLMEHLEKLFKPGMTWENQGKYWHIDHVIPVSIFNFEKPEDFDFKLCWRLKNLQPLTKEENLSKGAKITKPFQPSLKIAGT
ncbi:MAG: NUMOD3 domain-containing DNA-binding protein [Methanolobus sp.]|uniref:NUMOD3 domain-containing DNA-binding protein n=1 Tax=Methanolobus sp. TaxID=1874737 RepID=UPI0027306F5F|nr:NUMOD3 domain-containing DNA-binding protein [Methanolobus sp.]MDP2218538.1 NUMOD3 domain-containing DNA-binding protein [Methanolobus sp.]